MALELAWAQKSRISGPTPSNGPRNGRAQKSLNFQGPPLSMALEMNLPASKSLFPAPFKQKVHI